MPIQSFTENGTRASTSARVPSRCHVAIFALELVRWIASSAEWRNREERTRPLNEGPGKPDAKGPLHTLFKSPDREGHVVATEAEGVGQRHRIGRSIILLGGE